MITTKKISSDNILKNLSSDNIPKHVAIIMDGNGRWAESKRFGKIRGHRAGMKAIKSIVTIASKIDVKYLTLYAFSSENWNRPEKEVNYLWKLLIEFLNKEVKDLIKNNVKIITIGDQNKIPEIARKRLRDAIMETKKCSGLILNLALNYGARDEIVDAFNKIIKKKIYLEQKIDAKIISDNLFTKDIPDPDLMIRTSGEKRLSNFLLWQLSYSELYFTNILWPDFKDTDFLHAIIDYQNRNRRFGGR